MVKKMKQVDDSFELGAFVGMKIDNWAFTVEALGDVSDGHDGFVLMVSGGYTWQVNNSWILSLGASTSYADDDYMSSFFDVDLRDSQRSGLNIYDADSGFKDVGCNIVAVYKWTDQWGVQASGGFTRLLNDAEDSPVVDDRGDENQFKLGFMAIYTF
jgi:outer membrane scaffolding protein for murein synthesis (MipA/OmpV family)